MSDQDALIRRIDTLEMRVTHQDRVIEDLNAAITGQWAMLDKLARRIAHFDERLGEITAGAGASAPESPPPHY